ncbi:hypothetical protein [Citrobacter phage Tr1]|nr:hypothetical protein [Citrobacter phage Tr1]
MSTAFFCYSSISSSKLSRWFSSSSNSSRSVAYSGTSSKSFALS